MDVERFFVMKSTPADDVLKIVHRAASRDLAVTWLGTELSAKVASMKVDAANYFIMSCSDVMTVPSFKLENILMGRGNGQQALHQDN